MIDLTDIVLRTIAVMSALGLGALLLADRERRRVAVPGAFLCFAVAAFFLTSVPGAAATLGLFGYALTALCVTKTAWFWLFSRSLFRDEARVSRRDLGIVAVIATVGTWQQKAFLPAWRDGTAAAPDALAGFGFEALLVVLVLLALNEAWRDRATDLVEPRRRLRLGFIVAMGAYLAATLGVQLHNLVFDTSTPIAATRLNMIAAAAACMLAASMLLRFRARSWLDPAESPAPIALSPGEAAVLDRLRRALDADRVFLEEGLTIADLAARLKTSEHRLRQVINHGLGYRNFNDFLHAYRIREACEALSRPERAREPVLSIAMNVGYGSIGAFNRAFKARIGKTPTDYRRESLQGSHAG